MTNLFTNLSNWKVKYTCALLMFVCVGVGTAWGTEVLVYRLGGDTIGGSNGYDTESTIYQARKYWMVTGNTTTSPWRIGGKKISNVDRPIYTTFTFTDDISKVTVETGTSNLDAVNSITLIVSSSQNGGGTVTSSLGKTSSLTSTTLTFNRPDGKDWSGKYFTIVFNVSKSANSNAYVQFKSAKFYKNTYTVSYNNNGGSGTMTDSKSPYNEGATVTVKSNTFTRDGYTFDHWDTKADDSGIDYDASETFNISANTTLYAQWRSNVSCDENPSVGSVSLNGSFNLSSIPLQASVSDDGGTGCTITDAGFVWTSDGTDPTISNNKTTGTYSTNITGTIPSAGSFSTGVTYKIKAYATNGHGDGLSSSSFTLIPRSVTFNLNGHGSSTPTTQYVNNGDLATDPSYSESVTGYTFGGWYKEAGCSNAWTFGSDAVSGENKTLYAKWTANEYTITLNQDLTPTSAGTTSITATYNSNSNLADAIDTPTKDGWTFAGYYTAKNGGGTQIIDADGNIIAGVATYTDASKKWIKASDVTLYAKWTCTVTWSVNGATNVYSAQTLTYNGTSTKVASVPSPPSPASYCGDKFVGWTDDAISGSQDSAPSTLFTTVGDSPELKTVGNVTFYAVFADYDE